MTRSHLTAGDREALDGIADTLGRHSELARSLRTFVAPPPRRLRLLAAGVVLPLLLTWPTLTGALGAPWPAIALAAVPALGAAGGLTVWVARTIGRR